MDLAIVHAERLPAGALSMLREAFDDAPILARVDLVDLAEASPGLRASVAWEGVRWSL